MTVRIPITFEHRVVFTENVFAAGNDVLLDVLRGDGEQRPRARRALLVLDAGVCAARPDLAELAVAWFDQRCNDVELRAAPLILPGGEACKNNWSLVEHLWGAINKAGLDRHSYVLVLGGGALLDLVGFAAATAHRGIRLVRLPTTTLSQGDGGVGVKNGVNYFRKKNWVGTFAVPFAVVNDLALLSSLPEAQRRAGFIEAIKVALIRDAAFYETIERSAEKLIAFDPKTVASIIERSARLHVNHIATGGDPFEVGSARPLDFGHWIAHKLEQITDFAVSHGEAVAIGICADLLYAKIIGLLAASECDRIIRLIRRIGFAIWHPALTQKMPDGTLSILRGLEEFREHLGGELCITLVTGIGQAVEVHQMDSARVVAALEELRKLGQP